MNWVHWTENNSDKHLVQNSFIRFKNNWTFNSIQWVVTPTVLGNKQSLWNSLGLIRLLSWSSYWPALSPSASLTITWSLFLLFCKPTRWIRRQPDKNKTESCDGDTQKSRGRRWKNSQTCTFHVFIYFWSSESDTAKSKETRACVSVFWFISRWEVNEKVESWVRILKMFVEELADWTVLVEFQTGNCHRRSTTGWKVERTAVDGRGSEEYTRFFWN